MARAIETLPPTDRVLSMVKQSFQGFLPAFPLFDKARFMSTFDSLDTSMNDPGWLACLNVILALQSHFKPGTIRNDKEDYECWRYFQTAFDLAGQLMTMHVTIHSVQALLGIAIVIQGTPDQGPVSLLVSAAMKLAHRMGLHRRCQDPNISAAELAERKQVFWIAYSIDKDLSLRMGQPSAQDDDDMDVELPQESDGSLTDPTDLTGVNFINFRARLAMIQGQIYKRLFSVKANRQPVASRALAATELGTLLQLWRASVPSDLIDNGYGSFLTVPSQQPITLQLLYFNSLAIVYNSLSAQPRYREIQDKSEPIELQLLSNPPTYATEARKAISLLQFTPRRRYACIWAVLYVFVKAATTLLENIVCDPWSPLALSDLKLVEPLLTLLGVLAKTSKGRNNDRITDMHRSCLILFQRAKIAIEGTYLANLDWDQCMLGGPSQEREIADDFFWGMNDIHVEHDVGLSSIAPGVSQDFAFAVEQQFQDSMMST